MAAGLIPTWVTQEEWVVGSRSLVGYDAACCCHVIMVPARPPDSTTTASPMSHHEALILASVPRHLRIKILYQDDEIAVIYKPCNLRSVPGNAVSKTVPSSSPSHNNKQQRTAQEAWELAIRSFVGGKKDNNEVDDGNLLTASSSCCLLWQRLSCLPSVSHVPRKRKAFLSFVLRNKRKFLHAASDGEEEIMDVSKLASDCFEKLHTRQVTFMNQRERTPPQESAAGQLELIISSSSSQSGGSSIQPKIHVVHRLDCETSGVMVFAKTSEAASLLGKAWRQQRRDNGDDRGTTTATVQKTYLALVETWPPFQQRRPQEGKEGHHQSAVDHGEINLPLAPSLTERLRWCVVNQDESRGKPSITRWKVLDDNVAIPRNNGHQKQQRDLILLQLVPVTGRTHQLRVHCSHMNGGNGIVGDSLYNKKELHRNQELTPNDVSAPTLRLHAAKLTFPHPSSNARMTFEVDPPWSSSWDNHC